MRKPTTKKEQELANARADRDAASERVSAACANLIATADRVVERLRRRAPRTLRLVKARHG